MNFKKTFQKEKIDKEGVFLYKSIHKYVVRVKGIRKFTTLAAFEKEQDALDYYNNWLKENK